MGALCLPSDGETCKLGTVSFPLDWISMMIETKSSLLRKELPEGKLYLSHQPLVASRARLSLPDEITSSVRE